MLIGGRVGEDARLGKTLTRVPAKRVIDAILKLIEVYKEEKNDGEKFVEWIDRVLEGNGTNIKDINDLKKVIDEVSKLPSPEEDPDLYMDYGNDSKFVARTARGECAA
jgi:sulfite reductase (ferredoxin)